MSKLDKRPRLTLVPSSGAPADVSGDASNRLADLAEAKRIVAQLIANDDAISAAEEADDKKQARALERQNRTLSREFGDFADRVRAEPPSTWLDIVIRAELAGYMISWNKPRVDWDDMLEWAEDNGNSYDGMHELAMAVLYLAEHNGCMLSVMPTA